jgi:hypothetical protein
MWPRLLTVVFLLALAGTAQAARPAGGAMVEAHKHYTHGHDWHVQLEVNATGTRLATIVAYSQECQATGFAQGVKLGRGGTFDITASLPGGDGTWTVEGRFTSPAAAAGTWTLTNGDCTVTGDFRANDSTGHFLVGNPYEYPPARITRDRRVQRLTAKFKANAWRFTPMRARALGYSFARHPPCPAMVHARKHQTRMWGRVLDPLAPQSLMYWCTPSGKYFILAGAMFRAPARKRPPDFGNLLQWHRHASTRTANWMTHLWLTPSLRDAWATCSPFRAFEAAGMFRYRPFPWIPETQPCSDTPRLGGAA